MKQEIRDGKVAIINETKEEAVETFKDYLSEFGIESISEKHLKEFAIEGGETNSQLREYASDYASEIHTEMCESKHHYKYQF